MKHSEKDKNADVTIIISVFFACFAASSICYTNTSSESILSGHSAMMPPVRSAAYGTGNPIHNYNDRRLTSVRNQHIGFIFQKYHLISRHTVLKNVMIPLLLRGCSGKAAEATAREQLEKLDMKDRPDHRLSEL